MELSDIQLGIEMAASIAVVIAASVFIFSNFKERKVRINQVRKSELIKAIEILSNKLEEGFLLREQILDANASKTKYDNKIIFDYVKGIEIKIYVLQMSTFEMWGTKKQKMNLVNLDLYTEGWLREFAEFITKSDMAPSVDDLLDKISLVIRDLSDDVKNSD
jgi:hypothetical protein